MQKNERGIVLVELAIVIVIVGLIIGGILAGKDMIRSSQMRSAVEESQFYIQALRNFQDKYRAMPGDFSTATSIWGAQHATPATCIITVTNLQLTCNGDGNGWITTQGSSGTYYEQFRAWQQLYLAGMVPQNVSPIAQSGGSQDKVVGTNIPTSKLGGAGWGLVGLSVSYVTTGDLTLIPYNTNDMPPNHVLILGGASYSAVPTKILQQPMLTAKEAYGIDAKIDDAIATTGKVVGQINPSGTACYASNAYSVTDSTADCTLFFKSGL